MTHRPAPDQASDPDCSRFRAGVFFFAKELEQADFAGPATISRVRPGLAVRLERTVKTCCAVLQGEAPEGLLQGFYCRPAVQIEISASLSVVPRSQSLLHRRFRVAAAT